ncbi:MAG TPA: PDZ domain-containing protein [Candidatus Elarobacter sp.]|nr:PDZ domain-containing protein [Candidatus Elarobacter sp.]
MPFFRRALVLAAALALLAATASAARAQFAAVPIALAVDASHAVQGILFVRETIPVTPGPLTLVYPKWIPGEHAPNGPIANVAGLAIRARGLTLSWRRDPVDLYAFHVDVPAGTTSLDVAFEYLGAQSGENSRARLSTPTIFTLAWNKVVLTPDAADYSRVTLAPSLRLPSAQWAYATALETESANGAELRFKPVSLEMLVDSPLDAGTVARTFDLGTWDGAPVTLAAFADTPEQLAASDKTLAKLRAVVPQMRALYRNRHWNRYTFLLTVSDVMPGQGVEHHQSSDNGTVGDFFTDDDVFATRADLLTHEMNHSWDGKFRRPAELATPNLQVPMIDDLLWVYEGMTQFYGNLEAERAGMRSEQQWLDALALTYASYDAQHGRLTRPLADTATSSSFLYSARGPWASERRGVDYYSEGELMWLEADVLIRRLSAGKKSLDDAARAFFGHGANTGPQVVPYTRDDIVAALNAVQPYDWKTFFARRVDAVAPHPPDFLTGGGYALAFTGTPSAYEKLENVRRKTIDLRYSLGIVAGTDGTVTDVFPESVAYRAGIGPGEKIVAVNDRALTGAAQLDAALRDARAGAPVRLLLVAGSVYRTVPLDYRGGPRYPHLERVAGTPDVLGAIAKPLPGLP